METLRVVIDDWEYLITHPNPEVAWKTGVELTKILGDSMVKMSLKLANDKDSLAEALPEMLKEMFQRIDPEQSLRLAKTVLSTVEVQGNEKLHEHRKFMLDGNAVKTHFHGHIGAMVKLVAKVLVFTHEDFFKGAMEGFGKMMEEE